jgi:hypothetical protein
MDMSEVERWQEYVNIRDQHIAELKARIKVLEDRLVEAGVMNKPRYNHAFIIAFTVISEHDAENVTAEEMREGIANRLVDLDNNPGEIVEACGLPYDTYEMQEGESCQ